MDNDDPARGAARRWIRACIRTFRVSFRYFRVEAAEDQGQRARPFGSWDVPRTSVLISPVLPLLPLLEAVELDGAILSIMLDMVDGVSMTIR